MKDMCKKYKEFYDEYTKEYGEKTVVLMQIGSFYQMLMVKNDTPDDFGNIDEVARLMNNIKITKSNKSIEKVDTSNPNMAGFPKIAVNKYIDPLIEAGYTVVLIDQDDVVKSKREVSMIYSPSMPPMEFESARDTGGLISINMEKFKNRRGELIEWGIVYVNIRTNVTEMYSGFGGNLNEALDGIYRVMCRYQFSEVILSLTREESEEDVTSYLDLEDKAVHFVNEKKNVSNEYKNEYLRRVYNNISFGIMEPIEYFGLEQHEVGTSAMTLAFEFISRHDKSYLENIAVPSVVDEADYLMLEMNTVGQLNIFPNELSKKQRYDSLIGVIDKTSTVIGKRALRALLSKPYIHAEDIKRAYDISDAIGELEECERKVIRNKLTETLDFCKMHRKMSLGRLTPSDFYDLHCTYLTISELKECVSKDDISVPLKNLYNTVNWIKLEEYIKSYTKIYDLEKMKGESQIFKRGEIGDLDKIYDDVVAAEARVEELRGQLEKAVNGSGEWVKLVYSDTEGYYFTCTKSRSSALVKDSTWTLKGVANSYKITSEELRRLSCELDNVKGLFNRRCEAHFKETQYSFYTTYNDVFGELLKFIERVDIGLSNVMCKKKYRYCRPDIVGATIDNSDEASYLKACGLRHPVIERVNDKTQYVGNDVKLDEDNNGMILYAFNACGKSSLLRSIGLCVVMAQCGLYVPCDSLELKPFRRILTQVDMYDNLWKSHSSFMAEMAGLNKIMKLADSATLVLSDELTKGTEVKSATSLFSAAVTFLVKRGAKFIFTTHLHDVTKCKHVIENERIRICHLSVIIDGDRIVFERKIKPGPTNEMYGIEVAKAMGLGNEFINAAYTIRESLFGKTETMNKRKSRYNSKKVLNECEVCGYSPKLSTDLPLDTHHINEQNMADKENYIGAFHKNAVHNLVCLCKSCHQGVHEGKLTIRGYIKTTDGVQLDYTT